MLGCQGAGGRYPATENPVSKQVGPASPAYYYFTTAQLKIKQGDINEAIWLIEQALQYDPQSPTLKLEFAGLLLIKKENERALELVNSVLDAHPDHKQALILAGQIHLKNKDITAAKNIYEKLIASGDSDQNTYLQLGRFYWDENDLENAGRVFEKMARDHPESYAAHYFIGKVLQAQGKLDSAEKAFQKSLSLEPALEEPRVELLRIYQSRQQQQKIDDMYREILNNNPENHKMALEFASHLKDSGKVGQALRLLAELGAQSSENAAIITTVFETFIENKNFKKGVWAVEGMLQGDNGNDDLHYLAGLAYDGLEDNEQALRHLLQVLPQSRFYFNAVVHSALLYHDMGKIDLAIRTIEDAVKHDPDKAEYFLYLGSFFEELERYSEAAQALLRGIALDQNNSKLYFRLGVVYDKMGNKQESMNAMKTVLRFSPSHAEALNYLGYTYADMGINLDEAENLIRSALKIKPQDGYITDSLGWVYFKKGNYTKALEYLQKAVDLVPDDPTILEHLGDLYLKMGKLDEAVHYYRRSLEKEPKNREVLKEKIQRIAPQLIQ